MYFELLGGFFIFCGNQKKRRHFVPRLCIGIIVSLALIVFFPVHLVPYSVLFSVLIFIVIFASFVMTLFFSFDAPIQNILFIALAAYTTQKIGSLIDSIFSKQFPKVFSHINRFNIYFILLDIACWGASVTICYFTLVRRMRGIKKPILTGVPFLLFISGGLLVNLVLAWVSNKYVLADKAAACFDYSWNIVACVLLLCVQFSIFRNYKISEEYEIATMLIARSEEQFKFTKENIAAINKKCHDIKYIVRSALLNANCDDEILRETLGIVDVYDKSINTGNSALDVLLSEKTFYCNQKNIKLDFATDGADISDISSVDIYVAFGNLLDNAILAVEELDEDKRTIEFRIYKHAGFVMIAVENICEHELVFNGGLPVSTKANASEHGYGLLGVKMIAEKYGGILKVSTDKGLFSAKILIPVKGEV